MDASLDIVETSMSEWPATVFKIFVGFLLKHLWDKFAGRTTYLHYTVNIISVGRSVADARFGTVAVTYNGNAVNNLYFCTVAVENRSNRDVKDLALNIYGDMGNQILMSHGYVVGSPNALQFTDGYFDTLGNAQTNVAALETALGRRDYVVPVLNRGSVTNIEFLGNKPEGVPNIYASSDHAGVKLKRVKSLPHFYGEPTNYCAWLGSLAAVALCFPLYKYIPIEYHYLAIFLGAALGIFAVFLGWAVMKAIRGIGKIVG